MDLYSYDPANGPAVPDLPPISIGALTIGLGDLFGRANGLVLPRTVVINETAQEFMLSSPRTPTAPGSSRPGPSGSAAWWKATSATRTARRTGTSA